MNILISFMKARTVIKEILISISIDFVLCKTNRISLLGLKEFMQSMVKICNVSDNVT